jgi:NurA-like 5'-3' nuclease
MGKRKAPVKWSEAEEIVLRELYGKYPINVIAEALKRSVAAVKERACKLGITGRYRRWSDEEVILLRELYSRSVAPEIARALGRSTTSVHLKAMRLGLSREARRKQVIVLVNPESGVEVTVDLGRMVAVFREDGKTAEVPLKGEGHGLAIAKMLKASGFVSAGGGWNGG